MHTRTYFKTRVTQPVSSPCRFAWTGERTLEEKCTVELGDFSDEQLLIIKNLCPNVSDK